MKNQWFSLILFQLLKLNFCRVLFVSAEQIFRSAMSLLTKLLMVVVGVKAEGNLLLNCVACQTVQAKTE